MKSTLRKIFVLCLAVIMITSLATTAFAADSYHTDGAAVEDTTAFTFTKYYELVGDTSDKGISPKEDFKITIKPSKVENAPDRVNLGNMPLFGCTVSGSTTTVTTGWEVNTEDRTSVFTLSAAEKAAKYDADGTTITYGTVKTTIDLPQYSDIGDYWYTVKENPGNTAGVHYDALIYYLHVQVIKDSTNTDTTSEKLIRLVTLHKPNAEGTSYLSAKTEGVTNTYSNGSLSVKKVVTGTQGDHTKDFTVKVSFTYKEQTKSTACPVKSSISYTDGQNTSTVSGWSWDSNESSWKASADITLKHGKTITFTNIPYGVNYTVQEDAKHANDGYVVPAYDHDNISGSEAGDIITGTTWTDKKAVGIISDSEDTVTITNTKDATIDVGVVISNAPFVAMIVLAVAAGAAYIVIRRKSAYEA